MKTFASKNMFLPNSSILSVTFKSSRTIEAVSQSSSSREWKSPIGYILKKLLLKNFKFTEEIISNIVASFTVHKYCNNILEERKDNSCL